LLFKRVRSIAELNSISSIRLHSSFDGKSGLVISNDLSDAGAIPVDAGTISLRAASQLLTAQSDALTWVANYRWPGTMINGNAPSTGPVVNNPAESSLPGNTGTPIDFSTAITLQTGLLSTMMNRLKGERALGQMYMPQYYSQNQSSVTTNMARSVTIKAIKKRKSYLDTTTINGTTTGFKLTHTFGVVARADRALLVGHNVLTGVADGSWPTNNPPTTTNCAGYMATDCPTGPLGPVLAAARTALLSSVPSKIRAAAIRAYDSLASEMAGQQTTLSVVSYWSGLQLDALPVKPVTGIARSVLSPSGSLENAGTLATMFLVGGAPNVLDPLCLPLLNVGSLPNIPYLTMQDIGAGHIMGYTADFSLGYFIPNVQPGTAFSTWAEFLAPLNLASLYTTLKTADALNPGYLPNIGDNDDLVFLGNDLFGNYVSGNTVQQFVGFTRRWYSLTEAYIKS